MGKVVMTYPSALHRVNICQGSTGHYFPCEPYCFGIAKSTCIQLKDKFLRGNRKLYGQGVIAMLIYEIVEGKLCLLLIIGSLEQINYINRACQCL